MTEPTDAELLAEWDRVSHIADAGQRRLTCLRAVLAKWGTPPAVAGEQVDRADAVNLARNTLTQYDRAITKKGVRVLAEAVLSMDTALTTPQPTQAQAGAVESEEFGQFLSDVLTAAGLVTHGKQCKALGERLADMCAKLRHHGIKGGQHGIDET